MAKLTKRQKKFAETLDTLPTALSLTQGVSVLKSLVGPVAKFNETLECHIRLGINVKHADQQVRSTVLLPEGTGKVVRVAVVARGEKVMEARAAGADVAGADDLIERIEKENFLDFDVLIATPDAMVMLAKLGKLLGPRGLMPNPKTGTVTQDVAQAIKDAKAGKVEFRADKQGLVHVPIGRIEFEETQILRNFSALYDAVLRARPASAKGTYVKSAYITSTMGPSIKLDVSKITAEMREYLVA